MGRKILVTLKKIMIKNDSAKKIQEEIDKLIKSGNTVLVASPETIRELQLAGAPIKSSFITYEEYLSNLLKNKQKDAITYLKQVPKLDRTIADSVVLEMYEEIRSSYALGFFSSTIVNSIFLLEYSMRSAIYEKRLQTDPNAKWRDMENVAMKRLIAQLKKYDLINQDEFVKLNSFNDNLRDPYLHINIQELTEGIEISELPSFNVKTGETIILKDVKATDHRFLWFSAKRFFDKHHVQFVMDFCIGWTNRLLMEKKSEK